uniref:Mitochondrial import inner membrane translocase subunit TIM50 n=1 Tax=Anthurium amnicola TaxID=1678845 RepID=A0A1D1YG99_9ARAE
MKAKARKDSIRGEKLHTCCKATKISKGSHFEDRASQLADNTSTHVPLDVAPVVDVSDQSIDAAKVNEQEDLFHRASSSLSEVLESSPDLTSVERKGSLSAGCHSILETIFSPILDHGEVQCTLMDHNIEDNEQPDLPHLVPDDSDDGCCTSNDYQSCTVVDYCISDSSDLLSFNGSTGFSDAITNSCFDYDHVDHDMMFDMPERYMILPFIERTRQANCVQYEDSVEEAVLNSDDSCLYLAIHQMKSSDDDIFSHSWDMEELGSFDPQLFIKNLPDLPETVSSLWPMLLPKETRKRKAITLVLDLDETLVHSTLEHCVDADFTFPVFFNMKQHTVYVRQRPYLHIFLERVAQMFELSYSRPVKASTQNNCWIYWILVESLFLSAFIMSYAYFLKVAIQKT